MTLFTTRRRKTLATVATCAVAGIATLAFAAFLQDSVGEGSVKVSELQPVTVTAVPAPNRSCDPGNPCDGAFRINNPNGALVLKSTAAAPGFGSSNKPGCDPSNLALVPQTGLSIPVPAGTTDVYVPNTFRLDAAAPDACQGAVIVRSATVRFSTP